MGGCYLNLDLIEGMGWAGWVFCVSTLIGGGKDTK